MNVILQVCGYEENARSKKDEPEVRYDEESGNDARADRETEHKEP